MIAGAGLDPGARPPVPATWRPAPRWRRRELGAMLVAAIVALVIRLHELTRAPVLDDNQDPLQFAWSGLTLVTRHVPYAWEVFTNSYRYDFTLHLNGTEYHITHPWFSHPPLFSILVGGWSYLMGARGFADVTAAMIRPVPVALSVLSMLLAYMLARRVLGMGPALLGMAAFAVSPGAVLFSREVETEALLAPLLLLSLLLVHDHVTGAGRRVTVPALVACCVAMPLTKVTGIVVVGALALLLLTAGRWRLSAACAAAGIAGLGAYALYGAYFDWNLFLAVMAEWRDLHRHGVMAGLEYIVDSAGIGQGFRDGWYHLGWLGLGYLAVRRHSGQAGLLIALPCFAYAAGIALLGDATVQGVFGWYRIVLYPLLYSAAAVLAWEAVYKGSIPALLAVLTLGGATATEWVLGRQWSPNPYLLAAIVAAVILPSAVAISQPTSPRWRLAARLAAGGAVFAVLAAGAVTSWILGDVYHQL